MITSMLLLLGGQLDRAARERNTFDLEWEERGIWGFFEVMKLCQ